MAGDRGSAGDSHPVSVEHMNRTRLFLLLASILVAVGCVPGKEERARQTTADSARVDSLNRARQDSINRASPEYVVDSILPVEETMRRFRAAIGGARVTAFTGSSPSREALVRRFINALAVSDSADLGAIALNAREFIDLVYPESPYTHPPYRQSPALVWNQIQNPSASGLTRLVRRLGNQPLRYVDHRCDADPDRQGRNLIWTNCIVRLGSSNEPPTSHRLFGSIIQRNGRFKIVSYKNQF